MNFRFPSTKESFFYEREARSSKCKRANYRRRGRVDSKVKLYAFDSAHGVCVWGVAKVQEGLLFT